MFLWVPEATGTSWLRLAVTALAEPVNLLNTPDFFSFSSIVGKNFIYTDLRL